MPREHRHAFLMSGLLEGWDWFDNGLQNVLMSSGLPSLNKSQSMMVLYISAGVQRPIEIARKMRLSRQAISHIARQLTDMGMITAQADEGDARSKVLIFTDSSAGLRNFAGESIRLLEGKLTERLGSEAVEALRDVLNLDWGEVIKSRADIG
jgi:DNA-binding MarR family transcriptional regulator